MRKWKPCFSRICQKVEDWLRLFSRLPVDQLWSNFFFCQCNCTPHYVGSCIQLTFQSVDPHMNWVAKYLTLFSIKAALASGKCFFLSFIICKWARSAKILKSTYKQLCSLCSIAHYAHYAHFVFLYLHWSHLKSEKELS